MQPKPSGEARSPGASSTDAAAAPPPAAMALSGAAVLMRSWLLAAPPSSRAVKPAPRERRNSISPLRSPPDLPARARARAMAASMQTPVKQASAWIATQFLGGSDADLRTAFEEKLSAPLSKPNYNPDDVKGSESNICCYIATCDMRHAKGNARRCHRTSPMGPSRRASQRDPPSVFTITNTPAAAGGRGGVLGIPTGHGRHSADWSGVHPAPARAPLHTPGSREVHSRVCAVCHHCKILDCSRGCRCSHACSLGPLPRSASSTYTSYCGKIGIIQDFRQRLVA